MWAKNGWQKNRPLCGRKSKIELNLELRKVKQKNGEGGF